MARKIVVDDEVFKALVAARVDFESENDVLRRLLLAGDDSSPPPSPSTLDTAGQPRVGQLAILLERGLIRSGDELQHHRIRKGQVFTATVLDGGLIQTAEGVYGSPSPALKALVGSDINGWHYWIHTRSGKTLRELRASL
ncbi:hypothetical protein F3087_01820 [Nocardia colli]|uniref:RAMA domain-containing protein n=1 Tax=Nocardia colli TaxID=2545717 RepID=A0A5N0EMK5_9NOCA|nr:hypothetical protein [Nocardia colli]KAA8890080.1 hypothetical protein F3087_01820 [Nocardia colli]